VVTATAQTLQLEQHENGYFCSRFHAMASPCELLIETADEQLARHLGRLARDEALRIEHKFSRYRKDNIIYQINHSHGKAVAVEDETAGLLDYAKFCYELSEGMFDITSGVLGKAWRFDGRTAVPDEATIRQLLNYVGWDKLRWIHPHLTLREGMQIDLGGIGKEYAVDRVADLMQQQTDCSVLINFGGDLVCTKARQSGQGWQVGIEQPVYDQTGQQPAANTLIEITQGGLATSGDARRHINRDGKRYGHILNPKSGWPVSDAPCSVTVAAASCTEAGILATLAMLRGEEAEAFLDAQAVPYWVVR